ncbi:MAG TPA: carboxypeptidase-like regulatory domain-containing protein [Pirellulales bacterium]|jgi:hypothetical protein|nr:carboxypeptidase-like regulatory domain-containing protein [Pirellulales bacterium]
MRYLMQGVCWWVLAGWLVFASKSADAATVQGRVVDSTGRPVAGAEVCLWQKLPQADGQGVSTQPVKFADGDALVTDAEGRFVTPDVLVGEAFARVVAEAAGMLAGRSGWLEIGKDASVAAPDIVLKRLRAISGKVVDGRGRPVAVVTVFNTGDGHERVETMSQDDGTFQLTGVPEGPVFLFAEKPGYRFTGLRVSAAEGAPVFTLATVDEPAEPIATLPPLVSDEEKAEICRQMLDPWLDEVARSGVDVRTPLLTLADLDPVEAYNRAGEMHFAKASDRTLFQHVLLNKCIERRALPWDELRTLIESTEDRSWLASFYVLAARQVGDTQDALRRDWLAAALLDARRITESAQRAQMLALVAAGLSDTGDEHGAAQIMSEAEKIAEQLPPARTFGSVFYFLAYHLAKRDPARAQTWLDKIKDDNAYTIEAGQVAARLVPEHPAAAEEVWNRASGRADGERRPGQLPLRSIQMADFCYGMAGVDLVRAERLAREGEPFRVRGLGAAALRLAESDPAAARKLLQGIVRDELPRATADAEFKPFEYLLAAPITAAWILPIAERIDPQLGRECFWRSLALRPPRPRRDKLDDEVASIDIALTMMLGRYDREVARELLAPLVARLPELAQCGSAGLESRHAPFVYLPAGTEVSKILVAALYIDARWSAELFRGLSEGESTSERRFHAQVRGEYVPTLARHAHQRWGAKGRFSPFTANYWTPNDESTSRVSTQAK